MGRGLRLSGASQAFIPLMLCRTILAYADPSPLAFDLVSRTRIRGLTPRAGKLVFEAAKVRDGG